MLSLELAKKQIDAWRVEDEDCVSPRVKKLSPKLRTIAYSLLDRDAKGNAVTVSMENYEERNRARNDAIRHVDKLSAKERLTLFAAWFGDMARDVETGWQFLKTSTYQPGDARRSFRAPNNPEATLTMRDWWLRQLIRIVNSFRWGIVTPAWLAAWTPHLGYLADQDSVGRLLAALIDAGGPRGDELFDIVCQSVRGEHEIGAMGRHVSRALLMASRPEGWELMEKTLLAAQRQEGLRQVILETVDEAHPEAFRRMLRLVRDHDLARFSAVVRAANVWFGLAWDSVSVRTVNATIDQVIGYLDDPKLREKALRGDAPEGVFLALWSLAYDDAMASIPVAEKLLKHENVEIRFVAVLHLSQVCLPETGSARAAAMNDEDPRVALCALQGSPFEEDEGSAAVETADGHFERVERLFQRLPAKSTKLKPLVWPWTEQKASREVVASHLVRALGNRPPTALLPYLPSINTHHRAEVAKLLAQQKKWDRVTREAILRLAGDASSDAREAAYEALGKVKLKPGESEILECYLTRKTNDLRQGVLGALLRQTDALAMASAERLLESKNVLQRLAGLEILRQLAQANRCRPACQHRAGVYRNDRKRL
ncbi:MAG: hypothetical protein GX621_12185, partial [Pirellulaceae bacterium]|nr:hypothetical protein [Pirellulaceae bacterium]